MKFQLPNFFQHLIIWGFGFKLMLAIWGRFGEQPGRSYKNSWGSGYSFFLLRGGRGDEICLTMRPVDCIDVSE
jgi:hypothetical protein